MRDENSRRGFNRERHTSLKLGLSAFALAGFAFAWLGFSSAHDDGIVALPPSTATPSTGTVVASITSSSTPAEPAATRTRARTSRGS